jgi:hypothetical protein
MSVRSRVRPCADWLHRVPGSQANEVCCHVAHGGLCRLHHELKQLPGWQLSQDANGTFSWTTPAGLTYRKEPYRYPV